MAETKRSACEIAAEIECAADGLFILAQLFDGDDYKQLNSKIISNAIYGYHMTLSHLSSEVIDM